MTMTMDIDINIGIHQFIRPCLYLWSVCPAGEKKDSGRIGSVFFDQPVMGRWL